MDTVHICRAIVATIFTGRRQGSIRYLLQFVGREGDRAGVQMEADWEIEIGGDAPVIEAIWAGSSICVFPRRAANCSEARQLPGLAEALVRLNAATFAGMDLQSRCFYA